MRELQEAGRLLPNLPWSDHDTRHVTYRPALMTVEQLRRVRLAVPQDLQFRQIATRGLRFLRRYPPAQMPGKLLSSVSSDLWLSLHLRLPKQVGAGDTRRRARLPRPGWDLAAHPSPSLLAPALPHPISALPLPEVSPSCGQEKGRERACPLLLIVAAATREKGARGDEEDLPGMAMPADVEPPSYGAS